MQCGGIQTGESPESIPICAPSRVPSRASVDQRAAASGSVLGAQRNGWHLVCHPGFIEPLVSLGNAVEKLRGQRSSDWPNSPRAKLLKRILEVILDEIPASPGAPQYEQGNTLGADARRWRRAKFLGRFRLFFRFDTASRVIVCTWVNDENTLRKAGAGSDPYAVFRRMLIDGNPPHDWDQLLRACLVSAESQPKLAELIGELSPVPASAKHSPPKTKRRR